MESVPLDRLADVIDLVGDDPLRGVQHVKAAHSLTHLEDARPGTIVVLDPALSSQIATYQFDMALAKASTGVVAVLSAPEAEEPQLTSRRIANNQGIALGRLKPGVNAVALALLVRDQVLAPSHATLQSLDELGIAVRTCESVEHVPGLIAAASGILRTPIALSDIASTDAALPVRVQGQTRHYIDVAGSVDSPLLATAAAQLAHHVESVYQQDYDTRELAESTRSELLNEILLSDPTTAIDAINRLRRANFPIDGSHYAIRIDCHDPLPDNSSALAVARCQARLAETLVDIARSEPGQWTRAGTSNSILLLSTMAREHSDLAGTTAERIISDTLATTSQIFPGLQVHVGVGTSHLAAAGIRTTVIEATTAARAARTRAASNTVEHFDRLGFGRALVRWAEIDGVRPVINEILAPVLAQGPRQARESLRTLRAYLDAGRNIAKTAEALHLHRNTVRYRVDRLTQLLPVDLDRADDRLLLELSCRVVDAASG